MSKITLNRVASLINAPTALNGIISQIESAFDRVLFRDGTTPNQMSANLDMNSNRILNLPYPSGGSEPIRLRDFPTLLAATTLSNSDLVWVWQIKKALKASNLFDTVEAAISPVTSDNINMFWSNGGITARGDSLSNFIKTTLSWTDGQITTLYETAKTETR